MPTLPWPPKELTPNFKRRSHWTQYSKQTSLYRMACRALTLAEKIPSPPEGPIPITITFHPPDRRRRDDDGMIGAFKAGRDGIADALRVDDHRFRASYIIGEPVKGGCVIVAIGETNDPLC